MSKQSERKKRKAARRAALTPKPGKVSDEVYLAEIDRRHTYAKAVRAVCTIAAYALPILALWPVAYVISGKTTVVNVELSAALTVSFSVAGSALGLWGNSQKRRADRVTRRNDVLSRDVKELQRRLKDNGLPSDVTRG